MSNIKDGFLLDDSHLNGNIFGGLIVDETITTRKVKGTYRGKKRLPKPSLKVQKN